MSYDKYLGGVLRQANQSRATANLSQDCISSTVVQPTSTLNTLASSTSRVLLVTIGRRVLVADCLNTFVLSAYHQRTFILYQLCFISHCFMTLYMPTAKDRVGTMTSIMPQSSRLSWASYMLLSPVGSGSLFFLHVTLRQLWTAGFKVHQGSLSIIQEPPLFRIKPQ
jgi:hypothetical protein